MLLGLPLAKDRQKRQRQLRALLQPQLTGGGRRANRGLKRRRRLTTLVDLHQRAAVLEQRFGLLATGARQDGRHSLERRAHPLTRIV